MHQLGPVKNKNNMDMKKVFNFFCLGVYKRALNILLEPWHHEIFHVYNTSLQHTHMHTHARTQHARTKSPSKFQDTIMAISWYGKTMLCDCGIFLVSLHIIYYFYFCFWSNSCQVRGMVSTVLLILLTFPLIQQMGRTKRKCDFKHAQDAHVQTDPMHT